jgi:hypothetical protein
VSPLSKVILSKALQVVLMGRLLGKSNAKAAVVSGKFNAKAAMAAGKEAFVVVLEAILQTFEMSEMSSVPWLFVWSFRVFNADVYFTSQHFRFRLNSLSKDICPELLINR